LSVPPKVREGKEFFLVVILLGDVYPEPAKRGDIKNKPPTEKKCWYRRANFLLETGGGVLYTRNRTG